ncbi:proline-rich acidic protein 1 isoform X2 [Fukomys damarensis]|uniref:proline-rich acidic protein 1 isoform X2 n=1 Tax=Fukomys damarensis TaxID=885580 RepID=UPI00053FBCA1|nr:proline-rich acidic protein 1 isoform X2 [Fukomys damarensis]
MRRLFLVTCLVAVLLQEDGAIPAPEVPDKIKGKHSASEQDTEKAWSDHILQPLTKDNQLEDLFPVPKPSLVATEEKPGNKAWVETEDILSHFRRPQQDPEPDCDSLYHPASEEIQVKEEPFSWAMLSRQVLQGPEEDLDHIYHPVEES